jgi:hypothetical protein
LYDIRSHNIDKLRYAITLYDWTPILDCYDIDLLYTKFLVVCKYLIHLCIPVRTVTLGLRDPDFINPFVKYLLRKRYKLRRKGRADEANLLADKINDLIAQAMCKRLSNLHNSSTKLLWKRVNQVRGSSDSNSIGYLINDINSAYDYFANISFDPSYDRDNVMQFYKPPQSVHAGRYFGPTDLSLFTVERFLCTIKSTSLELMVYLLGCFNYAP